MLSLAGFVGGSPYMIAAFDVAIVMLVALLILLLTRTSKQMQNIYALGNIHAFLSFCYTCFIKPHTGDHNGSQQEALESFYRAQAAAYDVTRSRLLHGREDMLALVAGQLKHRERCGLLKTRPVWIDFGGGTGWNIEEMDRSMSVPEGFDAIYLVDLSPSLCDIARSRFDRLGWKNVYVICEDARSFRLPSGNRGAGLITFSYALSMIPNYYPVIDSMTSLLSPDGVIGVCDFYVQSEVDYRSRNYTGGAFNRHCTWLSRIFWRTWFEVDRVNLDPARRDYLEYRFGTVLSVNARNHFFGVRIPYYAWIGCSKDVVPSQKLDALDATATQSPTYESNRPPLVTRRSKAYESAVVNLSSRLPLPASWYQNQSWRIYYDEQLQKHTRFNNEYIYAFTWEDSRVDSRLLKIRSDDVVLAITSAGDNILSLALDKPRCIHAVDLNPMQNHLLELKIAAFTALGKEDVWRLFGDGRHSDFRKLLIHQLSPHMSSLAFQYWLQHGLSAFSGQGFYHTGRSRHALQLVGWLFRILGLKHEVDKLCAAETLNEQREIWQRSIRRVLMSRLLSATVISNEKWLWKVMGVPPAQRQMLEQDSTSGNAIYDYVVNTLDPVVHSTLLSADNHYYLLTLQGRYTPKCHPEYLSAKAHAKLSHPNAFDGLRIHTDEMQEVIARMAPKTLSVAVVMDSMDWFLPKGSQARRQVKALNRVLQVGGRVLLRSAGLDPWYIAVFLDLGFAAKRVAARVPGTCVDRVNMYASTWICTKTEDCSQSPVHSPTASRG